MRRKGKAKTTNLHCVYNSKMGVSNFTRDFWKGIPFIRGVLKSSVPTRVFFSRASAALMFWIIGYLCNIVSSTIAGKKKTNLRFLFPYSQCFFHPQKKSPTVYKGKRGSVRYRNDYNSTNTFCLGGHLVHLLGYFLTFATRCPLWKWCRHSHSEFYNLWSITRITGNFFELVNTSGSKPRFVKPQPLPFQTFDSWKTKKECKDYIPHTQMYAPFELTCGDMMYSGHTALWVRFISSFSLSTKKKKNKKWTQGHSKLLLLTIRNHLENERNRCVGNSCWDDYSRSK